MAYERLEPAHEEQIREMKKDGKTPQEISDFFKKTYRIDLPLWKVTYIVNKKRKSGEGGGVATQAIRKAEGKRKAKKQQKEKEQLPAHEDDEDIDVQELMMLLQQIDAGYKKILAHFKATLKQLRSELVKSRAQVQKMMQGAGIETSEEEGIKIPEV